ncbi:hypothetical protein [Planctomycetes bacterium K23_9]|uniref:Uncharacterized protein n=1 Tax=Stieleria marina TaxID=1930275 RepID=A0A517NTI6_9BACT|nr:hypothetical protein K239x_23890 [Planctomycetes bacterium K23_9]
MTEVNPYQPPEPIENAARRNWWQRLWQKSDPDQRSVRTLIGEAESVADVLSGTAFMEYGVVFTIDANVQDRIFAAIPVSTSDAGTRQRCAREASFVLQELIERIAGLSEQLNHRDLVVSIIDHYQVLNGAKYQVVCRPDQWQACHREKPSKNPVP